MKMPRCIMPEYLKYAALLFLVLALFTSCTIFGTVGFDPVRVRTNMASASQSAEMLSFEEYRAWCEPGGLIAEEPDDRGRKWPYYRNELVEVIVLSPHAVSINRSPLYHRFELRIVNATEQELVIPLAETQFSTPDGRILETSGDARYDVPFRIGEMERIGVSGMEFFITAKDARTNSPVAVEEGAMLALPPGVPIDLVYAFQIEWRPLRIRQSMPLISDDGTKSVLTFDYRANRSDRQRSLKLAK